MPDKTVAEKLLFKSGKKLLIVSPPEGIDALLGPLPAGIEMLSEAGVPADIILVFVKDRREMEAQLPRLKAALHPKGALWVAYYKGSARVATDIHRDSLNAYAGTLGMTGVAIISIDQDWSALRLKVL
jgi:hypothetical protein